MKPEIVETIIRIAVLGKILGILGMLQPWNIWFFENGFYILWISTLVFIIAAHLPVNDTIPTD